MPKLKPDPAEFSEENIIALAQESIAVAIRARIGGDLDTYRLALCNVLHYAADAHLLVANQQKLAKSRQGKPS